jgi:hypothetical protein
MGEPELGWIIMQQMSVNHMIWWGDLDVSKQNFQVGWRQYWSGSDWKSMRMRSSVEALLQYQLDTLPLWNVSCGLFFLTYIFSTWMGHRVKFSKHRSPFIIFHLPEAWSLRGPLRFHRSEVAGISWGELPYSERENTNWRVKRTKWDYSMTFAFRMHLMDQPREA